METMVIHSVLKQGNHGKIQWCFETETMVKYNGVLKQVNHGTYTIHLPYTIYEKAGSTTVYYVMSWFTM